ncbi:MAG TPA: hypothetical protein ENH31_03650 [Nitrospirae bacterium]|nr:hypothetical protein BMS3Abin10_01740 [bacterium BMS3Abin10]GBE39115.1 hypothetical protein BMS3Bbin08_01733 [bacterium BMS3Bbin08]HDH51316.1 hypothetical protein [Nitrospirota bacterium]HDK81648.1 hypothetical protein [Nitrospirota bacterium]
MAEGKIKKSVSIMCFHDELIQVYNALMTALSLLRAGARVTIYFGAKGINVVHRDKIGELACLPDEGDKAGKSVLDKMEEMNLPEVEDLFIMLTAEGATILACPLNMPLFGMKKSDLIDGVEVADPATYYKDVVMKAEINMTF